MSHTNIAPSTGAVPRAPTSWDTLAEETNVWRVSQAVWGGYAERVHARVLQKGTVMVVRWRRTGTYWMVFFKENRWRLVALFTILFTKVKWDSRRRRGAVVTKSPVHCWPKSLFVTIVRNLDFVEGDSEGPAAKKGGQKGGSRIIEVGRREKEACLS